MSSLTSFRMRFSNEIAKIVNLPNKMTF